MPAPCFHLSFDLELHWGVFDKRDRAAREMVYKNTHHLVPRLLDLLESNGIRATWATVGSLWCKDEEEWRANRPETLPAYTQKKYDAWHYAQQQGIGPDVAWAHFAPGLVQRIAGYAGQELATHTFSHYYCLEPGQSPDAFAADLAVVQRLAVEKTGHPMRSLVFPRNQYSPTHLQACHAAGIRVIRSNPPIWYWKGMANDDTPLRHRLMRTADAYLPLGAGHSYPASALPPPTTGMPRCLPASRLLRGHHPRYGPLNRLRLHRILQEMTTAARRGHTYHLWAHPEHLGAHPVESMLELQEMVQHFRQLQDVYGMESRMMREG